jgi:hypothetical protein
VTAKLFPARDCKGRLIDVVAVELTTQSPWWLRRGRAAFLGEDVLEYSLRRGWPVWLTGTPDEWLAMNGFALCVLNWSVDLYPILSRVQLVVERSDLANYIRHVLTKQRGSSPDPQLWTYDSAECERWGSANAGQDGEDSASDANRTAPASLQAPGSGE